MLTFCVPVDARLNRDMDAVRTEAFIARMRVIGEGEARMAEAIADGANAEPLVCSLESKPTYGVSGPSLVEPFGPVYETAGMGPPPR